MDDAATMTDAIKQQLEACIDNLPMQKKNKDVLRESLGIIGKDKSTLSEIAASHEVTQQHIRGLISRFQREWQYWEGCRLLCDLMQECILPARVASTQSLCERLRKKGISLNPDLSPFFFRYACPVLEVRKIRGIYVVFDRDSGVGRQDLIAWGRALTKMLKSMVVVSTAEPLVLRRLGMSREAFVSILDVIEALSDVRRLPDGEHLFLAKGSSSLATLRCLLGKVWSVYESLHQDDLTEILRQNTRLRIAVTHLEKMDNSLIIRALCESGLVQVDSAGVVRPAKKRAGVRLTKAEDDAAGILANQGPMNAADLLRAMAARGNCMVTARTTLDNSPVICRGKKGGYALWRGRLTKRFANCHVA
ncbi:MAG: hypothetical protein D6712_21145 [Chloroflexi bacterium]|nr:MAG: hypothetical protein D6712_21145 [Chloroflexota bacterium]